MLTVLRIPGMTAGTPKHIFLVIDTALLWIIMSIVRDFKWMLELRVALSVSVTRLWVSFMYTNILFNQLVNEDIFISETSE